MKIKEDQKRRKKVEDERYERMHDKDMAQYLGGAPPNSGMNLQQMPA